MGQYGTYVTSHNQMHYTREWFVTFCEYLNYEHIRPMEINDVLS